jgi:hypothetical protein
MEADAWEIKARATRRVGELIEAQRKSVGLAKAGRKPKNGVAKTPNSPTLADVGIDKNLAKEARKMAAVPAEQFDKIIADGREHITEAHAAATAKLVNTAPTVRNRSEAGGVYVITKQLPERDGELEYRIKRASELHERVARESELAHE